MLKRCQECGIVDGNCSACLKRRKHRERVRTKRLLNFLFENESWERYLLRCPHKSPPQPDLIQWAFYSDSHPKGVSPMLPARWH